MTEPVVPTEVTTSEAKPSRNELIARALPLLAGIAVGLALGLRLAKHLGMAQTPTPAPVVHARQAPCHECEQRAKAAHAANEKALADNPLPPNHDLFAHLSEEDKARVLEALREQQPGEPSPLITVGNAPPIVDLP